MTTFDRRRHPVREDLAAASYRGKIDDRRFVDGVARRIGAASVPLRPRPDLQRSIDTEALFGEAFTVYDEADGWAWGQLETDGYVGWLPVDALADVEPAPTHRVIALRTYRYPDAELKHPPRALLSVGARVTVTGETVTRDLAYAVLPDGSAVVARHLAPLDAVEEDWVAVAERFVGTPYLWGGRTSVGLDCSALIQLSCQAGGITAPRDSDMQEAELGTALDIAEALASLRRGDLVFWKGHVGVMTDAATLLHANGHTMTVSAEPLSAVIARLDPAGLPVAAVRRLRSVGDQ